MLHIVELLRQTILTWAVMPSEVLYPILGGLVMTTLWLQMKTPSMHKVQEGVVVESWFDAVNAKLALLLSVGMLVITPLWGLWSRTLVALTCIAGLALVANHLVYGQPLRELSMHETRFFIGLPSLVIADVIIGVPAPLAQLAALMTITSLLTVGLIVERELDNDKGHGGQADGIFVTIIRVCRWALRGISLIGLITVGQAIATAGAWLASCVWIVAMIASLLLISVLVMAFFNVQIPTSLWARKEET